MPEEATAYQRALRVGFCVLAEEILFNGVRRAGLGLGDLVLTCTDDQSRNRRMGLTLARGASVQEAEAAIGQVVEGVGTTREIERAASRYGAEMPICHAVYRVLYEGLDPREAVRALLSREDAQPERR